MVSGLVPLQGAQVIMHLARNIPLANHSAKNTFIIAMVTNFSDFSVRYSNLSDTKMLEHLSHISNHWKTSQRIDCSVAIDVDCVIVCACVIHHLGSSLLNTRELRCICGHRI